MKIEIKIRGFIGFSSCTMLTPFHQGLRRLVSVGTLATRFQPSMEPKSWSSISFPLLFSRRRIPKYLIRQGPKTSILASLKSLILWIIDYFIVLSGSNCKFLDKKFVSFWKSTLQIFRENKAVHYKLMLLIDVF